MDALIQNITDLFTFEFTLELIGFVLNLGYLYFVIKQKSVAWIWSIAACAIFVWICFTHQLYLQTGLYIFYIFMAVYGLFKWMKNNQHVVRSMNLKQHVYFIAVNTALGLGLGAFFHFCTKQHLPFLDGLISAFAVGTTLLIISKHRENWLYWIVINLASMYLYISQDLYWLTTMSFILMLVAIRGFFAWNVNEKNPMG